MRGEGTGDEGAEEVPTSPEGTSLRPVDLAREAGVSTQQIRNYEAAGVLPPVTRTPSGYRTFTGAHRRALLAYRALAGGFGPAAAQAVMLAVHAGDVPLALRLIDEGHASLHEQRLSLEVTGTALEEITDEEPDEAAVPRSGLSIGELAARLRVRTSALRVWESAGLLGPRRDPVTNYRRYGAAEVRDARLIDMLRRSRYPLPRIRTVLDDLRATGSRDALRSAIAQRQTELTQRARAMLDGAARLNDCITAD